MACRLGEQRANYNGDGMLIMNNHAQSFKASTSTLFQWMKERPKATLFVQSTLHIDDVKNGTCQHQNEVHVNSLSSRYHLWLAIILVRFARQSIHLVINQIIPLIVCTKWGGLHFLKALELYCNLNCSHNELKSHSIWDQRSRSPTQNCILQQKITQNYM